MLIIADDEAEDSGQARHLLDKLAVMNLLGFIRGQESRLKRSERRDLVNRNGSSTSTDLIESRSRKETAHLRFFFGVVRGGDGDLYVFRCRSRLGVFLNITTDDFALHIHSLMLRSSCGRSWSAQVLSSGNAEETKWPTLSFPFRAAAVANIENSALETQKETPKDSDSPS